MSSLINDIEEKNAEDNRKKAKELNKCFLSIFKQFRSSSGAKRSDETLYSEIFDAACLYFTYFDSCKVLIEFLITLEAEIYRGNKIFECSDKAITALEQTEALSWIHGELSQSEFHKENQLDFLVSRLQLKNSNLFVTRIDQIHQFTSIKATLNSVTNLEHTKSVLKSNNKEKINKFIKLINILFNRVIPICGIKFPKIILNQFSLPKPENDFFSILQELACIFNKENLIVVSSQKKKDTFVAAALNIVADTADESKKSIRSFDSCNKHNVIEELIKFSTVESELFVVEENLTQLNYSAILAFSEHDQLNSYLQYIDRLWLQKTHRLNAKPLLEKDSKLISNKAVASFLQLNLDECLKRIQLYFINESTNDHQLALIEDKGIKYLGKNKSHIKLDIMSEIKQACASFENKNEIKLGTAFTFSNSWTSSNENHSEYRELISRVILRLIIHTGVNTPIEGADIIKQATQEELCCLYRELFNNYLLGMSLGDNFKDGLEKKYENYQKEIFTVFKLWLTFLISQNIYTQQDLSFKNWVHECFKMFISYSKKPASVESFIFGKKKDKDNRRNRFEENLNRHEQVPQFETKDSINDANLSDYLEYGTLKYEPNNQVKKLLKNNDIELWDFVTFTSTKKLANLWDTFIGVDTKELVVFSLIQDFLNKTNLASKKEKLEYLDNRKALRNHIKNTWRDYFFKKISNLTFPKIIFNFNKSFEDKLKNKIEVLSNLTSLNNDRYSIGSSLGHGAFGVVYKAKDLMFNTNVAIKLIPHWFTSEEVSKRLIEEAAIMRNSQHENVVIVYDLIKLPANSLITSTDCLLNIIDVFDDHEYVFALIMEEVNNGLTLKQSLLSELTRFDTLSPRTQFSLNCIYSICDAVENIHKNGIVHGDIKPENILIDEQGTPKLTDFGIATQKGETSIGASSLLFSSPNALSAEKCTTQDDIFSLAILSIYVICPSLRLLFQNVTIEEVNTAKKELYLGLLQSFIILYIGFDIAKRKDFKIDFLEKYKYEFDKMQFCQTYEHNNLVPNKPAISTILGELGEYLGHYSPKMLVFLHQILKALSPSFEGYTVVDIGELQSSPPWDDGDPIVFDPIESPSYFSFFLSQCETYKPLEVSSNVKLWGKPLSKKDIFLLPENKRFTDTYQKHFYDESLSNLKIELKVNIGWGEDFILWTDENQGLVVSRLSYHSFSSKVMRLIAFSTRFKKEILPVVLFLKEINNKNTSPKITLDILEHMMLMHQKVSLGNEESPDNIIKQPDVFVLLSNELWDILSNHISNFIDSDPISDRKKAIVYLDRVYFKEMGIDTDDIDYDNSDLMESMIKNAIEENKGCDSLTLINAFYNYICSTKSDKAISEVKGLIERFAKTAHCKSLLKEFESLNEQYANDWEYQLYKEYDSSSIQNLDSFR
ncbi:serine/threonine-protein kinase [Thalassotalea piscium]